MSLRKQLELLYAASCPNDMPDDCGIIGDCAKCQTDQVMEFIRAYIEENKSPYMRGDADFGWDACLKQLLEGLDAEGRRDNGDR